MELVLYNTLQRKKEKFVPIKKGMVGMYSCGPTVYDYAHMGNHRTNILTDLLKRSLIFLGFTVNHVMNITDVDDKTIKGSVKEHVSLNKFTRKYEKTFLEEIESLNIIKANHILRATEEIESMVDLIKNLIKKEYAYRASDGIYFSVDKAKHYGKLAKLKKTRKTKQRIINDEYDKDNVQDFALWKFYEKSDGDVCWETDLGKGRPGWHVECSAMAMKMLGDTIDIHTGGSDLIFPHHTNEVAQSEASTGKKFVNYWIHGGMLTMKDKMSKSLGNVFHLKNLPKKGYSPLDYRYFCLTKHYRSPLSFSWTNLNSAKNAYARLQNIIAEIKDDKKINKKYIEEFTKAIKDDLNAPKALQVLWKLVRDKKARGKIETIKKMDEVLGLDLLKKEKLNIPKEILALAREREVARENKEWKKADKLREIINKKGYILEDTKKGFVVKKSQ